MARGRFRREKAIEARVCKRALEELGVPNLPVKLVAGATTGWPDRIFLLPGGRPLFIEMKDPEKGVVSPKQHLIHKMLRDLGYEVQVHDNEQEAVTAIGRAASKLRR